MTLLQQHKRKWSKCELCDLYEDRRSVVLLRGSVPAPVLFVGEAPGESEDVLGRPFTGPAGHLLDEIIDKSGYKGKYAITNIIACIPRDWDGGKVSVPPKESVLACADRLNEFGDLVSPTLVVAVGKEAEKWLPKVSGGYQWFDEAAFSAMVHPASILRANVSMRELMKKRAIVSLKTFLQEVGL